MAWVSPYIGRIHTAYYGWGDSSIWMVPETAILWGQNEPAWLAMHFQLPSVHVLVGRVGVAKDDCVVFISIYPPWQLTASAPENGWLESGRWSFPFGVAVASWQVLLLVSGSVFYFPRWWLITFHYVYPDPWGNDPIWLVHILQMGWFNHQEDFIYRILSIMASFG